MKVKKERCPITGCNGGTILLVTDFREHRYECSVCGAKGPIASTHSEALDRWNQMVFEFNKNASKRKEVKREEREERVLRCTCGGSCIQRYARGLFDALVFQASCTSCSRVVSDPVSMQMAIRKWNESVRR